MQTLLEKKQQKNLDNVLARVSSNINPKYLGPRDFKTNSGKMISVQQLIHWLLNSVYHVKYSDYKKQLQEYERAARLYKHMYANSVLDGNATSEMTIMRDAISDFDAAIKDFTNKLKNNTEFNGYLYNEQSD